MKQSISLEQFVVLQMEEDYFPMDFVSYGADLMRVAFNYNPAQCEKFKHHSEGGVDLSSLKMEEGV